MHTTTTQEDFWAWLRAYVPAHLNQFGHVHPFEIRKRAAQVFGLRSVPDVWAWQKANRRRIRREINAALRPLGMRISTRSVGYMKAEKIA